MYLSVIIPAKNEEKHIQRTVQSVFDYLTSHTIEHEIIVVSNGSVDKTDDIVRRLMMTVPTLKLIDYRHMAGKGYAVKQGMLKAIGQFRLFMDADNSTSIDHLEKMMPYFEQGYGVAIGSIAVKGTVIAGGSEPAWRRLFGKIFNIS